MIFGRVFFVVTPIRVTSCGSLAVAAETLFCAKTVAISGSEPTSKDICNRMVPSLELVDFM